MFIFDLCQYFDSYLNYLIVLLDYHFYHRIDHYIYHLLCLAYRSSIDFTMLIKNWLIALIFWYFIDFTVKVVFYYLNLIAQGLTHWNYCFLNFKELGLDSDYCFNLVNYRSQCDDLVHFKALMQLEPLLRHFDFILSLMAIEEGFCFLFTSRLFMNYYFFLLLAHLIMAFLYSEFDHILLILNLHFADHWHRWENLLIFESNFDNYFQGSTDFYFSVWLNIKTMSP